VVERYFKARYGDQVRLRSFKQLLGGRSKQTALLSFDGLRELPEGIVIRRDQMVQTMTGSVVTEFPLLQKLFDAGVAVPQPLFLETSEAALGKPFAVVERLPGMSLGTHFSVPEQREVALALAEQLAKLHSIPAAQFADVFPSAPLEDSPSLRLRRLEEMRSAWSQLSSTPSITMEAAFRWLEQNIDCATGPLSLVHGDLGFHNMLIDGPRLTAILDWETAHIDHPACDLGYVRPVIEQMVPWSEFMNRYRAAGGRAITPREVHFFGMWEIIGINIRLRHCRTLYETGGTEDPMLGEVGTYYVPRFLNRISQHLRRALHDAE
jgi:aminoglycoside phosphotransferase (APT) family kinase protein